MDYFFDKKTFKDFFIKKYASHISIRILKKNRCLPKNGYLWMICDRNLINNLKGIDAKAAYDNADKEGAIVFQYDNLFNDDLYPKPITSDYDSSTKIDEEQVFEFYVFGKDFSWCYIVTHEFDACGPFFIMLEK